MTCQIPYLLELNDVGMQKVAVVHDLARNILQQGHKSCKQKSCFCEEIQARIARVQDAIVSKAWNEIVIHLSTAGFLCQGRAVLPKMQLSSA